ncbi:MAG: methyltransferase [Gammaproteobacteria bacterium]|nr:methyltransferase [Gammaproteobacteria bacterium]
MRQLPSASEAQDIRTFLHTNGYAASALRERFGRSSPPTRDDEQAMLDATREINLENLLARLFLMGKQVDSAIVEELVPAAMGELLVQLGLLETVAGKTRASIVIVAIDDMLFASDAFYILGTAAAAEFVLPASTHSGNFLRRMMLAKPASRTLDLGCGCGLHAVCAAKISAEVVATDVSDAAIHYTRLNALLNELPNIDARTGSLFDPVRGEQFDWIISNPPFVVAPGSTFVYRDNEMLLDDFCHLLVRESAVYLVEGGHLQMLAEWVEFGDEHWSTRVASWIRDCDAWIVHSTPLPAAEYVRQRSTDIVGDVALASDTALWLDYLREHGVKAIHPGLLTLRRRSGDNWMKVFDIVEDDLKLDGQIISNGIAAIDFLQLCDDEALRDASLLRSQRRFLGGEEVAAYVELHDGTRDVQACIELLLPRNGDDATELSRELLETTRTLLENGYLVPIDAE